MSDIEYATDWFARAIRRHDEVRSTRTIDEARVHIVRKHGRDVVLVPVGGERLVPEHVDRILDDGPADAIVVVSTRSHYDWAAREVAEGRGSTVQTMKEVYGMLSHESAAPDLDPKVRFALERVPQNDKVSFCEMVCEGQMVIERVGRLSTVTVSLDYRYEFTEEDLVAAIAKHPEADAILDCNPNGRPTDAALRHAADAGVGLFKFRELMGALNRDGDGFVQYRPPDPRRR